MILLNFYLIKQDILLVAQNSVLIHIFIIYLFRKLMNLEPKKHFRNLKTGNTSGRSTECESPSPDNSAEKTDKLKKEVNAQLENTRNSIKGT